MTKKVNTKGTKKIAINHCEITSQIGIGKKMTKEDFTEVVMVRSGEIVLDVMEVRSGKTKSKPSKVPGVEIVAHAIATHVIDEGAERIAKDIELDLKQLKDLASSKHISFC